MQFGDITPSMHGNEPPSYNWTCVVFAIIIVILMIVFAAVWGEEIEEFWCEILR